MTFHLRTELPLAEDSRLDHESTALTEEEVKILKLQITRNARVIGAYIERLDLFTNKECYPRGAVFLQKMRRPDQGLARACSLPPRTYILSPCGGG